MDIGKEKEKIHIEPAVDPIPKKVPAQPERPRTMPRKEPVETPEPGRRPIKVPEKV